LAIYQHQAPDYETGCRMFARLDRRDLIQSIRTAITAGVSLVVARLFGLPEAYWAPITTLVIAQITVEAAWIDSRQRFIGTLLGAVVGALLARYVGASAITFVGGVFGIGLICAILKLDRPAYRFGSITIAIVVLVTRSGPQWMVAGHRFIEVSLGIAVALAMAWIWPEPKAEGQSATAAPSLATTTPATTTPVATASSEVQPSREP
jgi:uncharacterized membrane protein YccC